MTEDLNTKDMSDRELLLAIRGELHSLNDRVATLEARTNPLPPNYNERFTALETNIRELQSGQRELQSDVRELQAGQYDINGALRDLRGEQRDLKAELRQRERGQQIAELGNRVEVWKRRTLLDETYG
ncbi:MAG: hypothetical protein HYR56_30930 [Acidobacteria bacterium]|nr:hypothetical protein [Acidobacteriota bacterium]MBI3425996.1 hypothetical protein [Acidobacteriota bacterium]